MKKLYDTGTSDHASINLSPLIDMMFLLLIFFIVTTVFVEEVGVDIQRPKASTAVSLDKKSIIFGITRDGRIVYGQRDIGINGVRGLVAQLIRTQEMPVIIMADEKSQSGLLVNVIDECRVAGAKQVSVATEKEGY